MFVEGLDGIGLVVLRADREDDSPARQFARMGLNAGIGLAQRAPLTQDDALETVIADDAAPKRIVEIENEAFAGKTPLGG